MDIRLALEHIQACAQNHSISYGISESTLVNQLTPRSIDENRAFFHRSEGLAVNEVTGVGAKGRMKAHEVSFGQQGRHRNRYGSAFYSLQRRRTASAGENYPHSKTVQGALCYRGADSSHANDAQRSAGHCDTHWLLLQGPVNAALGPHQRIALGHPSGYSKNQGESHIRRCIRENARRVGHDDAGVRRSGYVNVVIACCDISYQPQLWVRPQHVAVDAIGQVGNKHLCAAGCLGESKTSRQVLPPCHVQAGLDQSPDGLLVDRARQ